MQNVARVLAIVKNVPRKEERLSDTESLHRKAAFATEGGVSPPPPYYARAVPSAYTRSFPISPPFRNGVHITGQLGGENCDQNEPQ